MKFNRGASLFIPALFIAALITVAFPVKTAAAEGALRVFTFQDLALALHSAADGDI